MNARVNGDPEAPRKINPSLSPELEEIILHALERDPRHRYQNAEEMQLELEDPSRVTVTHRDQRLRAPQPTRRSNLTLVLVLIGVLGWIALFVVLFVVIGRRHP
jgi:serine/threonine protein kinase